MSEDGVESFGLGLFLFLEGMIKMGRCEMRRQEFWRSIQMSYHYGDNRSLSVRRTGEDGVRDDSAKGCDGC